MFFSVTLKRTGVGVGFIVGVGALSALQHVYACVRVCDVSYFVNLNYVNLLMSLIAVSPRMAYFKRLGLLTPAT